MRVRLIRRERKTVCRKTRLEVISKRRAANDRLSSDFEEEMWKIDRSKPPNFLFPPDFKVVFALSINGCSNHGRRKRGGGKKTSITEEFKRDVRFFTGLTE